MQTSFKFNSMAVLLWCARRLSLCRATRPSLRWYSELKYPLQLASVSEEHAAIYEESLRNPKRFWGDLARRRVRWMKEFETVMNCDMKDATLSWFDGGTLNVSGRQRCRVVGGAL